MVRAYSATIIRVWIIGFSYMFLKKALLYSNPVNILTIRFTLAFILIMAVKSIWIREKKLTLADYKKLIPLGIFYPLGFFGLQVLGMQYCTSSEAGIIFSIIPVFTILIAHFFIKEKVNLMQKFMIFLSVMSICIMTYLSADNAVNFNAKGTVFILGAVISSSFYIVLTRKYAREYDFRDLTFFTTAMGFCVFFLLSILTGNLHNLFSDYGNMILHPEFMMIMLFLGIPATYITAYLNSFSLVRLDANIVAVINNLTPLVSTCVGIIFLKEHLYTFQIVGMVCAMGGTFGTIMFSNKGKKSRYECIAEDQSKVGL